MQSSYVKNNYGEVFKAIVDAFKPNRTVELGILHGYSTLHIAEAMMKNGGGTEFDAYDLFEDYPYNHGKEAEVRELLKNHRVKIIKGDAWKAHENYSGGSIAMLHVDLSNTGETVRRVMENWDDRMCHGGIILFEGGTEEGDKVEWRVKYNAPSIKKELETNKIIEEKYVFATYLKFPGLTMLLKKR